MFLLCRLIDHGVIDDDQRKRIKILSFFSFLKRRKCRQFGFPNVSYLVLSIKHIFVRVGALHQQQKKQRADHRAVKQLRQHATSQPRCPIRGLIQRQRRPPGPVVSAVCREPQMSTQSPSGETRSSRPPPGAAMSVIAVSRREGERGRCMTRI